MIAFFSYRDSALLSHAQSGRDIAYTLLYVSLNFVVMYETAMQVPRNERTVQDFLYTLQHKFFRTHTV